MFNILKADGDQRLVFGWANVSVTVDGKQVEDLEGDVIDPEELEKAAYAMEDSISHWQAKAEGMGFLIGYRYAMQLAKEVFA